MIHRIISEIRYRVRALFQRRRMDAELDEEVRSHLEHEIAKGVAAGLSPHEAERLARARFGAVPGIKEDVRDARGMMWIERWRSDFRYAARALWARKAFSLGVILTLGLGLGVNATMFGIVDRLLYRAPPLLRDPAQVHRVYRHRRELGNSEMRVDRNFPFATWTDLTRGSFSFEELAAFQTRMLAVGESDDTREVPVTLATASYFDFFRAVPVRGRFFTFRDGPDAPRVAIVNEALTRRFWPAGNALDKRLRAAIFVVTRPRHQEHRIESVDHGKLTGSRREADAGCSPLRLHARLQPGLVHQHLRDRGRDGRCGARGVPGRRRAVRGGAQEVHPQGHGREQVLSRHPRLVVQEQGRAAAARRRSRFPAVADRCRGGQGNVGRRQDRDGAQVLG